MSTANDRPLVPILTPLHQPTLDELHARYDCRNLWKGAPGQASLAEVADRAEVLVTFSPRGVDAATIAALPKLRLVACFGVGVDAVDLDACRERGIRVTNTPDVLTEDVADMAMALMLASLRRIVVGDRHVREGRWLSGPMPLTTSLTRKKVGIVGLGRIGMAIAQRCEAFGCSIAWHGPRAKEGVSWPLHDDPRDLAAWADVLVAACPGGPETRGIISRDVIEALGPQGVFVNIARGSVVDEPALVDALVAGRLGGAGLDVFVDEPRVPEALFGLDTVVLAPHAASGTNETRSAMGRLVLDNIEAWLAGRPLLTPVA
ncbi:MAG: 2-hydroxyacid dehydrogenase [Burkholderiaceae bacterium]